MSAPVDTHDVASATPEPRRCRTSAAGAPRRTATWAPSVALSDRRNLVRLITMALGIALCSVVVLVLASIDPAIRSISIRAQALNPHYSDQHSLFRSVETTFSLDGQQVHGLVLQATDSSVPPTPPGVTRFPGIGELMVSPALAAKMQGSTGQTYRSVLGAQVTGVIDPEVLTGPADLFFLQGADLSAALGAGTADGWGDGGALGVLGYGASLGPQVWSVLITGSVVVMVPLLLFTALAGRIGAERRDRRSALLRLLGASVGRLRALVAAEALLASIAGLVLAFFGYAGLRQLAPLVRYSGRGIQVADVWPVAWAMVLVLLGVPLLGVGAALAGSRQAGVGPLGVLSRIRRPPAAGWRLALAGAAVLFTGFALSRIRFGRLAYMFVTGDVVITCVVIVLVLYSLAALVGLIGERLSRQTRGFGTSWLLASRRITQDGAASTRAAAALATVLAGYIALMSLLDTSGFVAAEQSSGIPGSAEYAGSVYDLSPAEWARLDKSLQSVAGVKSAVLIAFVGTAEEGNVSVAVASCDTIGELSGGERCRDGQVFQTARTDGSRRPAAPYRLQYSDGSIHSWAPPSDVTLLHWPSSADQNELIALGSADFLVTPAAGVKQFPRFMAHLGSVQVRARMTLSAAEQAQQAISWLGWRGFSALSLSSVQALQVSPVPWIRGGLIGAGILTLIICALGQSLMSAEQLRQRRRALALSRASGVPLAVLTRSVLLTALLPVAVGVALAVVVGIGLSTVIQILRGSPVVLDGTSVLLGSVVSLAVAAAVALGSTLQVRRSTGPAALRTE